MPYKPYWFPAKTFGWGWGPPVTWQGWAVLIGYIAGLAALSIVLLPERFGVLWVSAGVLTVLLIVVCWLKGEPPGWRWGKR